ncbi:MAG TPA: serine/threonine-protein kinase [Thermoanaerobaculia bacterium]|nr:serine/threonine-protein kinase [Thermoanaerobaculia bacterium]
MRLERLRDRFFEGIPRYKWIETIGRGGMGVVFKAHDLDLDEDVAIKVLSPDLEYDENELLHRFKREINLNRKIKHPNVARIHDFGTSGDYPYITMEFIPGTDLRTFIQRQGRVPPEKSIAILRQIALGTEAAHKLGIVHRDLKSQNVMIDERGGVAILDFGLARGQRGENVTLDSIMIGTPHYMAPEQALGRATDHRVDIYSIGIMAFEMLVGRVPFTGEAPLAIAMRHVSEPIPEDLGRLSLPPSLTAVVERSLAKDPEDRFFSAAALEAELSVIPLGTNERGAAGVPDAESKVREDQQTLRLSRPSSQEAPAPPAPPSPAAEAPSPEPATSGRPEESPSTVAAGSPTVTVARIPKTHPPSILLVESDGVQRTLVGGYIEQFGCKVRGVGTGPEALELLLKEPADLVLMDVFLPGMDGFDVTRVVKSQPTTSQTPVILMANRLDRNRFAFGIQSGATDFLAKPLVLESMIVRLWSILQHRGFVPPPENETLKELLKAAPLNETPIPASLRGGSPS